MSDKNLIAPYIPTAKAGGFTARLGKDDFLKLVLTENCQVCRYGEIELDACPSCHQKLPMGNKIRIPCTGDCKQGKSQIGTVTIKIIGITQPYEAGIASGYQIISFEGIP